MYSSMAGSEVEHDNHGNSQVKLHGLCPGKTTTHVNRGTMQVHIMRDK